MGIAVTSDSECYFTLYVGEKSYAKTPGYAASRDCSHVIPLPTAMGYRLTRETDAVSICGDNPGTPCCATLPQS